MYKRTVLVAAGICLCNLANAQQYSPYDEFYSQYLTITPRFSTLDEYILERGDGSIEKKIQDGHINIHNSEAIFLTASPGTEIEIYVYSGKRIIFLTSQDGYGYTEEELINHKGIFYFKNAQNKKIYIKIKQYKDKGEERSTNFTIRIRDKVNASDFISFRNQLSISGAREEKINKLNGREEKYFFLKKNNKYKIDISEPSILKLHHFPKVIEK